ncbi:RNA polymerase sporulation-specific sigma factor [Desulfitispora alkaliphila]|uniref:sigma-70 family RNA polymerase sigma factor n=1 Tax=Desulfitispora alkaliphila TaxID=622674 RepID=UPI003D1B2F7E
MGIALKAMPFTDRELELFYSNYTLVKSVIRKYKLNSMDEYDDLFQEGCLGLLKAINKYNDEKNVKFKTFAYTCIDNEIKMYLRKRKRFFKEVIAMFEEDHEVASDNTPNKGYNLHNIVSNEDNSYNPEAVMDDKEEKEILKNILASLPDSDKDILFSFYGLGGKAKIKQSDLAKKYNVSQSRISKRIKTIIEFIQQEMEGPSSSSNNIAL